LSLERTVLMEVLAEEGHGEVHGAVADALDELSRQQANPVLAGIVTVDAETTRKFTHPRRPIILGHRKQDGSVDVREIGE